MEYIYIVIETKANGTWEKVGDILKLQYIQDKYKIIKEKLFKKH